MSETTNTKVKNIEESFTEKREYYNSQVKKLNDMLKTVGDVNDLLGLIYSERQELVENYYQLVPYLNKLNMLYRQKYAEKYKEYSNVHQKMYPESEKKNLIYGDLTEILYKRDLIDTQIKYFLETLKTIDSIIFGIKSKLDVEAYIRGIK